MYQRINTTQIVPQIQSLSIIYNQFMLLEVPPKLIQAQPMSAEETWKRLLQTIQRNSSSLECNQKNKATHLCVNPDCSSPSLHCILEDCRECRPHSENGCREIQLRYFTQALKTQSEAKRKLLKQMEQIEEKIMKELAVNKQRFLLLNRFLQIREDQLRLLEEIYSKPAKQTDMVGKNVQIIYKKLQIYKAELPNRVELMTNRFKEKLSKLMESIRSFDSQLIFQAAKTNKRQINEVNFTDSQSQKIRQSELIFDSSQACPSNNPVHHLCVNPLCQKHSYICAVKNCPSCGWHKINGCYQISFEFLFEQVKLRHKTGEKIKKHTIKMVQNMVQQLQTQVIKCSDDFVYGGLLGTQRKLLKRLVFQSDCIVRGKESVQLIDQLQSLKINSQQRQARQKATLASIQKVLESQIMEAVGNIRSEIRGKQYKIAHKIDSTIITSKNYEDFLFIWQQLNSPKQINLLFRASQHDFLAQKFHQKCDNIEHTLVLVKTEFGKVIGGYTPIKWQSCNPSQSRLDQSSQSFVFSANMRLRMNLEKDKVAIRCIKSRGPIFGFISDSNNRDLAISDKCNQSSENHANGPVSYSCEGVERDNQQFWTAFSGGNSWQQLPRSRI